MRIPKRSEASQAKFEVKEDLSSSWTKLSKANLRIHDAACPKTDGYFQVNLIREEQARAADYESYCQIFGDVNTAEDGSDDNLHLVDSDVALQSKSELDTLQFYSGSLASLSTPMDRFMALSPTQDTHPWMAKSIMDQSGIGAGDLEAIDVRKLASEVRDEVYVGFNETDAEFNAGSPCPSSDTLSVAKLRRKRSRVEGREQSVDSREKTESSRQEMSR